MNIISIKHMNFRKIFARLYQRNILCFVIGLLLIIILTMTFIPKIVHAEKVTSHDKTITSIFIKEGYTLWSIAKQYYTEELGDFVTYIEEIKRTNGLATDEIHAGSYLIIPYYEDEIR